MASATDIVGAVAMVAIALGALAWAAGSERAGKRAVLFGIVLAAVGEALAYHAAALVRSTWTHRAAIVLALLGTAVLVALLRRAWLAESRCGAANLSKKRRVGDGP